MSEVMTLSPRERFVRAAFKKPVDRPPVWLMRQAGRYLPEYRAVREKADFITMVRTPELAAEVTCQPIRRYGMDAAVIFSDILVPVAAMGLDVRFEEGIGPIVSPALRTRADIDRLHAFDPELDTGFVMEAIKGTRAELGNDRAIIGFAGAPFTTASYMIEGGSSREFLKTKRMLYSDPDSFRELLELVVDALVPYLGVQVEAGADALQLFDSWGGALDLATYRSVLFDPMERLICAIKALGVPIILYVNGASHLLEVLADLAPNVIGIDARTNPASARTVLAGRTALQGNLDPSALHAPAERIRAMTDSLCDVFADDPGFIANVGNGLNPETPVEGVAAFVETVKARRRPK